MEQISLFWHGKRGLYYLSFKSPDGLRRQASTGCRKKQDAFRFLNSFKIAEHDKRTEARTVAGFTKEYLIYSKGVHTFKTVAVYGDVLKSFLSHTGNKALDKVSVKDIETYLSNLRERASVWTAKKHFIHLAAAFSKAVEWRYIPENPFTQAEKPKVPEQDAPFVTPEQFRFIVGAIPNESAKDIATLAFFTGLRLNEILSLHWSAIDLPAGVLHVKNTASFRTKSGRQRSVPMNAETALLLSRLSGNRINESEDVFSGIRSEFASKQFKKAARLIFGTDTKIPAFVLQ